MDTSGFALPAPPKLPDFSGATREKVAGQSIERIPWAVFDTSYFDWRQGEHVTFIGPTDYGKSTLAMAILRHREYVVFFASKPQDPALDQLIQEGYVRTASWPPPPRQIENPGEDQMPQRIHPFYRAWFDTQAPTTPPLITEPEPKILLWPDASDPARSIHVQREVFEKALLDIFHAGGYAVHFDEAAYMARKLRLADLMETYWQQARSMRISISAATQRPADIPLEAYDQATHLFLARNRDANAQKRLGEIGGGIDGKLVARIVADLPKYDWLYVDTRDGSMVIVNVRR